MLLSGLRPQIVLRRSRVTVPGLPETPQSAADLDRRLRAVEKRERQLDQALAAVAAQREQLAAVQADYERRRDGLIARTREVQAELERLRAERAELVADDLTRNRPLH